MLDFKSNETIKAQEDVEAAERRAREEAGQPRMLAMSSHIHNEFLLARAHKDTYVTQRLLKCQRQKSGEYDPDVLAKIAQVGGCSDFFNISETKTDALESWIADVATNSGELPFAVLPTPIPDLPDDRKEAIVAETVQAFEQAAGMGEPIRDEEVYEAASRAFDRALDEAFQTAKRRAELMERKMRDQLTEGGWKESFDEFIRDYAAYPTAIMKGPMLVMRKRLKWVDGKTKVVNEPVHTWKRVSPYLWFPAPNIANPNQGSCCELTPIERSVLSQQRGAEGWNSDQINAVLASPPSTLTIEQSDSAATQALLESRDESINAGASASQVWGVEYHGSVSGTALMEWGIHKKADQPIDPLTYYEVEALKIGPYVVRCVLNPDALGHRKYKTASFVDVPGTVWGRGMLEKMADSQTGYNNASRLMMNAMAEASRPRTILDVDVISEGCSHVDHPGKVWKYDGTKLNGTATGRKPVEFYQPRVNLNQYLALREDFEKDADNRTLVPRYVHGDQSVGGAAATASGLSMLMNASHKGIKRTLSNLDRGVIKTHMQDLYNWNMLYLPDAEWAQVKGDCQIEARGALHLLFKEQIIMRRQEFLNQTDNPTDAAIIGMEGRRAVLESIADGLQLAATDVVPDAETLRQRFNEGMQNQLDQNDEMAGAGPGASPQPPMKEAA